MPNDLSISAAGGAASFATTPAPLANTPSVSSSTSSSAAPFPSPVEHLNAAMGIEVMQFVAQNGAVTQSFPSQRQIDAYRDAAQTPSPPASNPVPTA